MTAAEVIAAEAFAKKQREKLAARAVCVIRETPPSGFTGSVLDTFNTTVRIEGPTRQAVEQSCADYRRDYAGSNPPVAFYPVQEHDSRFVAVGSRGDRVAKVVEFPENEELLAAASAGGMW